MWTPNAVAEHHESLSRGDDMLAGHIGRFAFENSVMFDRWGDVLANDPFYNPHFSRDGGPFEVLSDRSLRLAPGSNGSVRT
ncbi:MAG TPA: hypothetical protein VMU82_01305 [Acetobacteraceae bacterium]|nr:hypothetical protein [Acetobacteraceae bacterium]